MPAARRICRVKVVTSVLTKTRRAKLSPPTVQSSAGQSTMFRSRAVRLSLSCPRVGLIVPRTLSFRQYSTSGPLQRATSLSRLHQSTDLKRDYTTSNAGSPCPPPCGPCCKGGYGCLPPPCNTPPKCLQYMTGYYYYPYGTWFCGPYHVAGTCAPVGGSCPCPCPVKCCPGCVCAPPQSMNASNKSISDINQFPVEVPCHTAPKVPQEARTGFSKMFSFNPHPSTVRKESHVQQKKPPGGMPPVLTTMGFPNSLDGSVTLMDKEPSIKSSYSSPYNKTISRSYHTRTNPTSTVIHNKPFYRKIWKYSYYQTRQKMATPTEKSGIFLKESKNSPRNKVDSSHNHSSPNQKRRDPRPDVDIELKPYDL